MGVSWQVQYLRHVEAETGKTLSAIAREAGLAPTTLTRPANSPSHKHQVKLATLEAVQKATGIPFASFQSQSEPTANEDQRPAGEQSNAVEDDAFTLIPVYDVEASAGSGLIPPEHEAIAYRLELPASYLTSLTDSHPRHLQVISVKGISMLPTLKPGDLVMIDRAKTSLAYDGLFVVDIDDAILVKRIGRSSRPGFVTVISDNKDQPSFERAVKDIRVLGKVIWAGVKQ